MRAGKLTGMAWQTCLHPGKFHLFGKSRHCWGFTSLIRQSLPCRKLQESSACSIMDNPWRLARSRVWFAIKTVSLRFRNSAMAVISPGSILTSPGQRQQAVQRWHCQRVLGGGASDTMEKVRKKLPPPLPCMFRETCGSTLRGILPCCGFPLSPAGRGTGPPWCRPVGFAHRARCGPVRSGPALGRG